MIRGILRPIPKSAVNEQYALVQPIDGIFAIEQIMPLLTRNWVLLIGRWFIRDFNELVRVGNVRNLGINVGSALLKFPTFPNLPKFSIDCASNCALSYPPQFFLHNEKKFSTFVGNCNQ